MIVLAAGCYITQGVLINLLFPWVISPLIVAWLWLKHEHTLGEDANYAGVNGFIAGCSIALLYCHSMWLWQGSVKAVNLSSTNMDFVITPLYAFALGTLGAVIGYSAGRFKGNSCHK
ncbi:hypothetical protein [Lacimicrobium alkaliphilum]|uniref:Uncharacterized protein n=1 Tax=Lacimicrobium alkaliphilum TaxID=1526571 RepID=A0A0U2JJ41_9ALTE|nr:hypothetical protein [Lacimicrobium alkaliphilum]ALS98806.1 hypothetical protein AT746_11350 [Lacimicrobium alkaliphilum]